VFERSREERAEPPALRFDLFQKISMEKRLEKPLHGILRILGRAAPASQQDQQGRAVVPAERFEGLDGAFLRAQDHTPMGPREHAAVLAPGGGLILFGDHNRSLCRIRQIDKPLPDSRSPALPDLLQSLILVGGVTRARFLR